MAFLRAAGADLGPLRVAGAAFVLVAGPCVAPAAADMIATERVATPSISVTADTGGLFLTLDSSGANALLGSPTSVLEYLPVHRAVIGLGVRGTGLPRGGWLDAGMTLGVAGTGRFRDLDFLAGQVLLSETFSDAKLVDSLGLGLRYAPLSRPFARGRHAAAPFVSARLGTSMISALNLRCGAVCAVLPALAPGTEVISHRIYDAGAGGGLELGFNLSARDSLNLTGEVTAGYRRVDDSHLLRPDLGPVPNIRFEYAFVRGGLELSYTRRTRNGTTLSLGAFATLAAGAGRTSLAIATPAPLGQFPSQMLEWSAGLRFTRSFDLGR